MISNDLTMAIKHRYDDKYRVTNMIDKIVIVLLILTTVNRVNSSEVKDSSENVNKTRSVEYDSGRAFSDIYQNGTFRTGNVLWDNILNQCTVSPSMSCLQKNVYSYIDEKLKLNGDVEVGGGVCFHKNNVDINKYSKEANIIYLTGSKVSEEEKQRYLDVENEITDDFEPESPIEEITDGLYDKSVKFLVTHDMKVKMPDYFFEGATLKVSPRALTKTGALLHVELLPKEEEASGRFFLNKIKKHIKKKLITAAIAIVLVVKLIALKIVFVLPLILGVTTAKKMFLKLLLFLFPALSHIFKLCSWYHQNYHTTKYHHHHHLITHHHKVPHGPHGHHSHSPYGSSLVVKQPGHGSPAFEHYPQDWELSGPGLGSEYLSSDIHRNAIANFKPHVNDANDINAWGLGMPPGFSANIGEYGSGNVPIPNVVSPNTGQKISSGGAGRPVGPPNSYYSNNNRGKSKQATTKDPLALEKEALIRAAALAARAPPSPFRDEILRVSAVKLKENNRVKTETELVKQQQEILAASDPETIAAEKFYGTLLDRVDAILAPLGANDAGCRERAVCSLYGDPFKHAPYSNLISNELSKDSSELLPAADSKMALRYYKYVQAARDGQEQKDCTVVYSQCHIDFNRQKKK